MFSRPTAYVIILFWNINKQILLELTDLNTKLMHATILTMHCLELQWLLTTIVYFKSSTLLGAKEEVIGFSVINHVMCSFVLCAKVVFAI